MGCQTPSKQKKLHPRSKLRKRWRRRWHYLLWRLARLQGKSHTLARGFSAGIFAASLPLFGFQIFIAVSLAFCLRGNKFLAVASTWISNPFTYVPIYFFNFQIGHWLLRASSQADKIELHSRQDVMELGPELIKTLLIGSLSVGLVTSISSYFLFLWLIKRVRVWYNSRY